MKYKNTIKSILDYFAALLALIFFSPILIIFSILLFFANKGKPFFYQTRPGKDENLFKIIKFKTMTDKKDAAGNLLPDKNRLTTIGKIVRKTSIDELPQLINILKGDMSFIGPRPLLVRYLPHYTEKEKLRHSVKPGITGLAQVSGRNVLNWDDRLQKDVEYVENLTLRLDFKIFFKTIKNVLASKDIVVDPSSIMDDLEKIRTKNNT